MAVIDRDRWRELARLLDHALRLTDEERAVWLGELRSRSPDLADEVNALLASEAAADRAGFLDDRPLTATREPTLADSDLRAYLDAALGDVYIIERELGGGGMSRVFLAREKALGRTVVIKVLLPVLAAGLRGERFAREVRVAAVLQHPNIVPLFKAGEAAGLPYYVMPYVSGESLRARLTRDGRLPLGDALSVLRDVARALAFAHEQGVVHRDVKPENVLLAGDAAVMTDFGIAKAISSAAEPAHSPNEATLSAVGSAIGTPAYMAPEQVTGDPRVDHRADLYAWGVLAYELLAGSRPFADRATSHDLLLAHLSETPEPLSRRAPELSPTLTALVTRCLEKDPASRPQSAREILDGLAVVATPPDEGVVRRWRARPWVPRATLAAAGVLAVALVGYLVAARRRDGFVARAPAGAASLAVLPFEAVGGDTANAYFGEGIADEIASALSKAGGLRIASPTSVAAFRSTHKLGVTDLGHRLGVNTVLEGRVRRSGDRMRLTVQLTNVGDGMALWGDEYERRVKDVFQVQDEIARSIVAALRARLPGAAVPQPGRPVSSPGTTNADAYDLYLRGSYLLERRGGGVSKSVEYFERAIAEDSTFARAYAALAFALELLPNYASTPPRTIERRTMDAARHALALDSTLSQAYTALGLAHMLAFRWRDAGEAFQRAVAVDPGFAPGDYFYGSYLMRVGRVNECEEHMRRARSADPLSISASALLAYCLSVLGRYDESLAESRRAYDLDSSAAGVRGFVPLAMLHDGHPDEARAIAHVAVSPPFNGVGVAAYVLAATGDRAGAMAMIRQLEARDEWSVATGLVYGYLGLGDTARALSALETAVGAGERPYIPFVDPMFDPVRRTARFAAVVRRLGLNDRVLTAPAGGRPR
jgi:eukaryotic-like serine/threonine-protein kinase